MGTARSGRPPKPEVNSQFERFRRELNLTYAELGARYGQTAQAAYRHCLSPADDRQQIPRRAEMLRIFVMSGGRITPNDFYELPALEAAA